MARICINIDNVKYKSNLLDNLSESEIIHLDVPIEDYYLHDQLSKLTLEQLSDYIKFWNYMSSDKYFYKGIYELCFVIKINVRIIKNY